MNVFLVCTGLGHINRGFESFTRECFDALKNNDEFDLYLVKGGGKKDGKEIVIPNFPRRKRAAKWLGKIFKLETYTIEQMSFCLGMLPLIIKKKPSVIYYSDFELGTYLWHLRKYFRFKYKLLFSNGAPNGPPFKTEDHVQQLLPVYLESAIANGAPREMQTLLPYGFDINVTDRINILSKKNKIREQLGLGLDQKIILSVGAINKCHKRMHYIIDEMAKLDKEYFLIILGQFEAETAEIIEQASTKIPGRFIIKNVSYEKVKQYYVASDHFVLASLNEGFGRVLIEAMSYGLPCIVHDYINAKEVLGKFGTYINMEKSDALAKQLDENHEHKDHSVLIESAYNLYSWDVLKNQYQKMILKLTTW